MRELVLPSIEREGPIEAWIIDDTGFPKTLRQIRHAATATAAGQLPNAVLEHRDRLLGRWRLIVPPEATQKP